MCSSCAHSFQYIHLAFFVLATLPKEESFLRSVRVFLDTPIPLLCRNIRQKHLLGWSCQIPPYEPGNEARLFPAPFLQGMVWATPQTAFPECELFVVSGTALLLAAGQSAPPAAHTSAPNAIQPCGAHHHTGSAEAPSAPRTLRGRAASFTSHVSQAVLIAQSQVCIHQTRSLLPSHLCFHTRMCSWNPPTLSSAKRQLTCTSSSFPFWRHSAFSTTSLLLTISTAQEFGSHCHSHLVSVSPIWFSALTPH